MAGPTEFSLESVRQFMLAREGRVTNHELVKHFKAWLTHPTEKESARQRFKEYVNTLATIKQDNGEKYLVLKKRYYPNFSDEYTQQQQKSPSLLDEVMAGYQSLTRPLQQQYSEVGLPQIQSQHQQQQQQQYYSSPSHSQRSSYAAAPPPPKYRGAPPNGAAAPPYRAPPPPPQAALSQPSDPPDLGLPLVTPPPSDFGLPTNSRPPSFYRSPSFDPYQQSQAQQQQAPPIPRRNGVVDPPPQHYQSSSQMMYDDPNSSNMSMMRRAPPPLPSVPPPQVDHQQQQAEVAPPLPSKVHPPPPQPPPPPPPPVERSLSGSQSSLSSSSNMSRQMSMETMDKKSMTSRQSSQSLTETDNKENASPTLSEKNEKISVKERTKTFNRMASEVELTAMKQQPVSLSGAAVKRRNSRAADRRGSSAVRDDDSSHDSSSISTLDQTAKLWMIKASQGDYHSMAKMLLEEPRLAKHKDFTNGYTALHWACKHGNLDMVKMLCGNYSVDVNSKSHGGYTPLHMSCQFGNQEVFDLLVKAYGADPNLRDNAGKKPRQYMTVQDQSVSLSSATFKQLKDRRRHRRQASEKSPGMLRFGSLSVKVKKTTEAFNNYFHSGSGEKKFSNGFDSMSDHNDDKSKMPPPKFAPIKKRKSKGSVDFGRTKSAPVTPTPTNDGSRTPATTHIKQDSSASLTVNSSGNNNQDSDSEYGFDSQWT